MSSAGQAALRRGLDLSRAGEVVMASARARLAAIVLAVAVAYHYSLLTLLGTLGVDTPLAYLGLIPVVALGLAALRARPPAGEPQINDRQVDFIVGLPLVAAAVAIMLFLPARMSTLFWYYRVDLLSLPLFSAGAIALLAGVRTLWRCRLAVGLLGLAWPLPYLWALGTGLDKFTGLTLGALHAIVRDVPLASALPGGDGSEFLVGHGAGAFQVSVASACAGVDSFLGFLLVGGAFLAFVDGRRVAKLAWLVSGLALVYGLNIGRILLIFWAGGSLGESFAMDGLHPFIGLLLFCAGVAVMVLALPRYRLRTRPAPPPAPRAAGVPPRWLASSGLRAAGAVLALAAVALGVANSGLSRYALVAGDLGAPRLTAFEVSPARLPGWSVSVVGDYPWTRRFFGAGSSWIRYQYAPDGAGAATPDAAGAATPVIADVVTTSHLGAFNAYGIQACYRFHGYGLSPARSYALGGGVQATLLTFRDPSLPRDWNALYWVWAVRTPHGTRYERIVLLAPARAAAARGFLVIFARALVRSRAVAAGSGAAQTATSAAAGR